MSWEKEVEELRQREAMAEKMGGDEKVARQHARGKLDARERLRRLVDAGSFREIGKIAGRGSYDENGDLTDLAASNFIYGRARIEGRTVVATADDFTVRGGAGDAALYRKFIQAEQMAHELRLPLIRITLVTPMCLRSRAGGRLRAIWRMCQWSHWRWARRQGWARRGWWQAIIA
jgi:acetyl-CoA carboxylase carboxyltransferase component